MKLQNETTSDNAPSDEAHGRWYGDACGTAFAMELVGERWSILIIRELLLGGRRFSDLRRALPAISAKVLTERLVRLEAAEVLTRRRLAPPAAVQIYELTEWGRHAEPAIIELSRWALRSPRHDPTLWLSPVALMLNLRTTMDPGAARALSATMRFEIGEDHFSARLADGELVLARTQDGDAAPDFTVWIAKPLAFLRLVYGRQPLTALEAEGDLRVTGDVELAKKVFAAFSLPQKIG
ncbi:MAG: winged helix-turn-helix transcriptional regulator [Candidatus Andeanibacterium colombiense]|uniref:Winged helix-turn-helix transcriptional regulator n=1 Tax=Candidatus Andeanibacterium colombiense TaxID=3121345 RepID=A0AAJ5X8G0_9SPHN|nr:MAG: winged helix-turn-helix transcriptional regulator [Sphingomonadaceae bacterium]